MKRHTVLCRASQATPENWVTLEYSSGGEDGPQWTENTSRGSHFKTSVYSILDTFKTTGDRGDTAYLQPEHLPAITITQRDKADVIENPPTVDAIWQLPAFMPDLSITILSPIRFEAPTRTHFEMWSVADRSRNRHALDSAGRHRFIMRELRGQMLRLFNDDQADNRAQFTPENYRGFSKSPLYAGASEIWIRPGWKLTDWPDLMAVFPEPKPIKPPSPEFLEAKAEGDKVRRIIKQQKSMRASQGLVYNPQRASWGKRE